MSLKDIVTKIIEDSDKKKNTPDTWENLKKKLKKSGYKENDSREYDETIGEISTVGAYKFLQVWETLDKYINKKGNKWGGSYSKENVAGIVQLCKIDNIEEVIRVLGETGYDELSTWTGDFLTHVYVSNGDIRLFKTFSEGGLYQKYEVVFKAIKNLGYKGIKSYDTSAPTQLEYLTSISRLNGAVGAVYALASNGYRIDSFIGLSKIDVHNIKQIIEEAQNEKGGMPVYLYEKGDLKIFQEYFNSISIESKKSALESILKYDNKEETSKSREEIQKWLEESYKDLLTEAGFS